MGDVIREKIIRYQLVSMLLALLLFIFLILSSLWILSYQGNERTVRIDINRLLNSLRDNMHDYHAIELPAIEYNYCVFDVNGQVLISTMPQYLPTQKVDLSTLGSNTNYNVPIISNESIQGLLLIDTTVYKQKDLMYLFIIQWLIAFLFLLGIILYQMLIRYVIKQDIWKPITEIRNSTRSILSGNMDQDIRYDYGGEIGELCHDFEQMRDKIKDSYKLEKESREKERVLYASISHDLKTPISIIIGYLEQIRYGITSNPEAVQETTKLALVKTRILNKLIDDILEHSKAELNQLSLQYEELYSNVFFAQLLEEYTLEAKQNHFSFSYMTPPAVLLSMDPDRIAQVIQNIIGNALKYSDKSPEINLSFEILESSHRILVISIQDNGPGIEATDLPFIFDLFYRGNKARTQNIPGSGLGLNICKYIIEQHGGQIECDSIAGVGTTISFSLPIL